MREPQCKGTYYQASESLLRKEISAAYHHDRGPGAEPTNRTDRHTVAIIAPNSPYPHCAPCAVWAYKALAESAVPDVYVIMCANHHSVESGITTETFVTPLGMVRVDQELARGLVEKGTISYDDEIHNRDHGIEVQLPYLQHAKPKDAEKLKILPIIVSTDINLVKLALDLKETLMEQNKRAFFIVSSDLLRHGPIFHYVKFIEDVQKNIYEFDAQIIDLIKAQNPDGFFNFVDKNFAPIDGAIAIKLLLHVLKPSDVKLEQYYTSADILQQQKDSVSYAAIVFDERN